MATMKPMSRIIPISDLAWEDRQPGVKRKSLWEDAATKRQAILTRIEPGAQLPRHRHVGDELIFVVEGAIGDDFGTVTAGNMGYRPNGAGDSHRRGGAGRGARQRTALGSVRAPRSAVDRGAARRAPEADLGGQGGRAPGNPGPLRAGRDAAPASPRG